MKIYNIFNPPPTTFEKNTGESLTQPDMTFKVRDILKRAESGQFVPVFQGDYDEEGKLSIIRKPDFDLTDLDTINEQIVKVNDITKKLKAIKKQKEEAQEDTPTTVVVEDEKKS